MSRREKWRLLGLGFVARVIAGFCSGNTLGGDSSQYLQLARNLANGHGYSLYAKAPYVPTDWRPPAYPAVLVPEEWLHAGHAGIVITNTLLAIVGLLAFFLIAEAVFANRPRLLRGTAIALTFFPSAVTYAGLAMSENVLLAAVPWLVYLIFYSPAFSSTAVSGHSRLRWFLGMLVSGGSLCLTHAEGVAIVIVGIGLAAVIRRPPARVVVIAVALALAAPVAWVVRNDVVLHRMELNDSMYTDAAVLQNFTHGSQTSPLYLEAVHLGVDGTSSPAARARYRHEMDALISRTPVSAVVKYKVDATANVLFTPLVWNWALEKFDSNYTLGDALRHISTRNIVRVVWSVALAVLYLFAALGLVLWWRSRRRVFVLAILLYPVVELLVSLPFQADPRQWLLAVLLAVFPAAEGVDHVVTKRQGRQMRGAVRAA